MAIFLTGFPGFLASHLVRALALRDRAAQFRLLVHSSQMELARRSEQSSLSVTANSVEMKADVNFVDFEPLSVDGGCGKRVEF